MCRHTMQRECVYVYKLYKRLGFGVFTTIKKMDEKQSDI